MGGGALGEGKKTDWTLRAVSTKCARGAKLRPLMDAIERSGIVWLCVLIAQSCAPE